MKSSETSREGFVLPAVIFTMAILGLLTVAALTTANDEHRSSRAVRESGAALYAAEAGAHLILGTVVDSPRTVLDTLAEGMASGDSVDLGWSTLPSGAAYHPVIHRINDGGKDMFLLMMVGRGAGPWGGERRISLVLTSDPGGGCGAIAVESVFSMEGNATIGEGGGVTVDGNDTVPPGWDPVCDDPGPGLPAISTPDSSALIDLGGGPTLSDPAVLETPFDATAFDSLFAALVAQATIVFAPGVNVSSIGPVENPPGVCDTSVNTNWGAPEDPSHPCHDYFPIIYAPGGVDLTSPEAGQGILVCCETSMVNFNGGSSFYGLVVSELTVELENGARLYGAALSKGDDHEVHTGSSAYYSSCALQRAAVANGLGGGGGSGVLRLIGSRAWGEF